MESAEMRGGNDAVVRLLDVSKTYEVWLDPVSRLKAPLLRRVAGAIGGTNGRGIRSRIEEYLIATASRAHQRVEALKPISLEVRRGEALGILGRNGSGKSTLLQIAAGTLRPTTGRSEVHGRVAALLQLGAGFNPDFTGRENVYLNAAVLGVGRREVRLRLGEVLEFADIGDFIDRPLRIYSSGMRMRLAFAVQVMLDPDVLLIDEALAVGDIFFQQKCFARLRLLLDNGTAVLFVSHDVGSVQQFCDRALVLDRGCAQFLGCSREAVAVYTRVSRSPGTDGHAIESDRNKNATPGSSTKTKEGLERWPAPKAFNILKADDIVGGERIRAVSLALCKVDMQPCQCFHQGERAVIAVEYEILERIERPSAGFAIRDRHGIMVHAKHMMQSSIDLPEVIEAGQRLRVLHEVELCLRCGQYSIELGVVTLPDEVWQDSRLPSAQFEAHHVRELEKFKCVVLNIVPRERYERHSLTHYGMCDLPGRASWAIHSDEEVLAKA